MKNMLKKMIALMLVLITVMSLCAFTALAEEEIITISPANDEIYYGDEVILCATVEGLEEGTYQIVWEYLLDGTWVEIGKGPTYKFVVDAITAEYEYRAIAIVTD